MPVFLTFLHLQFEFLSFMEISIFLLKTYLLLSFQEIVVISSNQILTFSKQPISAFLYKISDVNGVGRMYDGIGGLSGGGATSRLLINYKEPYRSEILDYLFKPQFGASLQILKVEIGGDAQSTEGTEHSHMHNMNDENYTRGYEWWLMKEAKSRNPNIKLVGLPWAWPGWIGQGAVLPYTNISVAATYIAKWIKGAKEFHNLTIDYVGIWNERPFDVPYIKELRRILDTLGFNKTTIIAADNKFIAISEAIIRDSELAKAVGVIGAHYTGTQSNSKAVATGKKLWSSEDYSTYNDDVGGGCWARLLNQNYVNGYMTATIAWNLIASYYDNLPYKRCSLMTANEPWSGHYELNYPLWVTAHTTQFTQPGWFYLHSVGHLHGGGSYVSLTDGKGNLTVVIETMSHDQSVCIRPPLLPYTVKEQNASFLLDGSFKDKVKLLHRWQTQLGSSFTIDDVFIHKDDVQISVEGTFNLFLPINAIISLSTISSAGKGIYTVPPSSSPFPLPYTESFNYNGFSEAYNFADQAGAFEIFHNASDVDGHDWTLRQVVTQRPLTWCDDPDHGVSVIGDYNWSNINVSVSAKIEGSDGVFIALRVTKGGCDMSLAEGLYFWIISSGIWIVSTDIRREKVLKECNTNQSCWVSPFYADGWNALSLGVSKTGKMSAFLNGYLVWDQGVDEEYAQVSSKGFVAIGTKTFGYAQFDDFSVTEC